VLPAELGDQFVEILGSVRPQLVEAVFAGLRVVPAHLSHGLFESPVTHPSY
jgi:hypothetical protein